VLKADQVELFCAKIQLMRTEFSGAVKVSVRQFGRSLANCGDARVTFMGCSQLKRRPFYNRRKCQIFDWSKEYEADLQDLHLRISNPQESSELTPDDVTALKVAETTVQLGLQFHDSIWTGYNLSHIPFIIYMPERWALLINASSTAEGFVDYPENWPVITTPVLYHEGQYRDLAGQLAFNVPVDSLTVCAVAFQGQSPRRFLEYVVHENFHQFQRTRFEDIPWESEELYPIEDTTNSSLACLEVLLLKDAVRLLRNSAQDSARAMMNQFLAVRSFRWKRADPYVQRYELGQELNEGTAKYVEIKAVSLVSNLLNDSPDISSIGIITAGLDSLTMSSCIIDGLEKNITDGTISPEDMPRNRIYPVGAAQGYLLDQLGLDWKAAAEKGGAGFTFAGLLRSAISFDSSRTESLVAEAEESRNYRRIYLASRESIAAYRIGFDSAMAAFESQPGIRIEISLNGDGLLRSRSSSARKWLVESGSKEYRDHFDIYVLRSLSKDDLPPQLRDANIPALMAKEFLFQLEDSGLYEEMDQDTNEKKLIFYCTEVQSAITDGLTISTTSSGEYQFESLSLKGAEFKLASDRSGTISISSDRISIDLL
jgi:hypothetical protein